MNGLRRFAYLPRRERRLLLSAFVLVAATRAALPVVPFRRLQARARRVATPTPRGDGPSPERVAWAVAVAGRYVPDATCLAQALALQRLLGRYGHRAELRIGVAKEDGDLKAHAWLEREGSILIGEAGASDFTTLVATGERA